MMPIASGLPDTKGEKNVVHVHSDRALAKALRDGLYASAANDYGAIGAWVDDAGEYRVEAHRWMRTVESKILPTVKSVQAWFKKWRKKIAQKP